MDKSFIRKVGFILAGACGIFVLSEQCRAQDSMSQVLSQIEKNNTGLCSLRKRVEAEKYGARAERAMDAPEVGFDYLWGSPAGTGNRKDISVTQTFDVAALTGARGKLADARQSLSDARYMMERKNVLLEAKRLYINIVYCNILSSELSARLARSGKMEEAYRDMQVRGETDMIEVNKAHVAYLAQKNALARNMLERENFMTCLRRLNGGVEIAVDAVDYPSQELLPSDFDVWYGNASQSSPELAYMRRNVEVNAALARTGKMENYPSVTAGYMAELVRGSNFRGLTLGLSIPLWSVRSKVRNANMSYEAAKLEEKDAAVQVYGMLKNSYDKAAGLRVLVSDLTSSLAVAEEAMTLTEHKLDSGEISLMDSILEFTLYYSLQDESLAAARDYQLALADLNAWTL